MKIEKLDYREWLTLEVFLDLEGFLLHGVVPGRHRDTKGFFNSISNWLARLGRSIKVYSDFEGFLLITQSCSEKAQRPQSFSSMVVLLVEL